MSWASASGEENVAAHHGSLSRKLRLAAEKKLKEGQVRVLVATASLELGIDVGTVDLAVQINSPRAGPGLFAALGDRPGIGVIVDGLYGRLERDRELARHFRSRRPGERERLKQFFETISGGEVTGIRDVGVQRRHLHRLITASESARWLSHLGAAMQAAGVGQSVQAAVMDLLRGPAARLVNDGAPKDVLKQALVLAGTGDVDAVASLAGETSPADRSARRQRVSPCSGRQPGADGWRSSAGSSPRARTSRSPARRFT